MHGQKLLGRQTDAYLGAQNFSMMADRALEYLGKTNVSPYHVREKMAAILNFEKAENSSTFDIYWKAHREDSQDLNLDDPNILFFSSSYDLTLGERFELLIREYLIAIVVSISLFIYSYVKVSPYQTLS